MPSLFERKTSLVLPVLNSAGEGERKGEGEGGTVALLVPMRETFRPVSKEELDPHMELERETGTVGVRCVDQSTEAGSLRLRLSV